MATRRETFPPPLPSDWHCRLAGVGLQPQAGVLAAMREYRDANGGVNPSTRSLVRALRVSTSVIHHHIERLEAAGLVDRLVGAGYTTIARGVTLTEDGEAVAADALRALRAARPRRVLPRSAIDAIRREYRRAALLLPSGEALTEWIEAVLDADAAARRLPSSAGVDVIVYDDDLRAAREFTEAAAAVSLADAIDYAIRCSPCAPPDQEQPRVV